MHLEYDHDDEASFRTVTERVVVQFEQEPGCSGRGWVVEQLLDFKHGYLDGELGRWTANDLAEILLQIYPRKVLLEPGDEAEVLAATEAFLRFLDAAGQLTGSDLTRLTDFLHDAGPPFAAAMADPQLWGPSKHLFAGATQAGVDLTDRDQLDEYVRSVNAMPYADRDRLLGPMPRLPGVPLPPARVLPPVVLAPVEEVTTAADQSLALRRVRLLIEHIGAGVALTDKGNLKLADGKALVGILESDDRVDEVIGERTFQTLSSEELPDVDWTFRLALSAGFIAIKGKRLVPSDAAEMPTVDPLAATVELWHAMVLDVGPTQHHWRKDSWGWGWYAEDVDAQLAAWHLEMYGYDAHLDLDQSIAELWDELVKEYELQDEPAAKLELHRRLLARAAVAAFRRLEELGIVDLSAVESTDESVTGTVALTPLGTWVVQSYAAQWATAPVVGGLVDLTAPDLLAKVVDLAEDDARLEVAHWTRKRGDDGAAQLVAALRGASQAGRGVAFGALLELGPSAIEAVEPLRLDPDLAPFRTVLRVDTLVADAAEMATATAREWVILLGTVLELRGPHAVGVWATPAAGEIGLLGMIDEAWRVRLPQTGDVLHALSSTASDKTVAKAARKAAYKFHSVS